ncbi:uncharacterized protein LAESUDRAFT_54122 [Laetiporus sulphureus 93-53]|uniref:DUF6533 domain-containing protein n=1 Tax=Laetiporus sulphureus 93-53 TaxID=1314785 RepID=A0A165FCC7_9APHY|nr:uncharacterized protein LAESUDRAFT_54122 [Laetiporus sulphureus 93-53]KZT08755.1 hypothetical protein LAESUDRAFT_54122 [Laetiporus sulphureus 93-53]
MSNASAASILAQEEADLLQESYIYAYCCLATTGTLSGWTTINDRTRLTDWTCSALIFFEHIVTFSEEVHVIWGGRLTTVTVIFALNRYLLMVQGVSNALDVIWWRTPLR